MIQLSTLTSRNDSVFQEIVLYVPYGVMIHHKKNQESVLFGFFLCITPYYLHRREHRRDLSPSVVTHFASPYMRALDPDIRRRNCSPRAQLKRFCFKVDALRKASSCHTYLDSVESGD